MKKFLMILSASAVIFSACNNDQEVVIQDQTAQVDMSDFYLYTDSYSESNGRGDAGAKCYSMMKLNNDLDQHKHLYNEMYNIEKNSRAFMNAKKPDGAGGGNPGGGDGGNGGGGVDPVDDGLGQITIPVYVHVIYNTAQENISDAQINSQLAVLNKDFGATNGDLNNVPAEFAGSVANTQINFTLAGITRKYSTKTSWGTNDAMKKSSQGGVDAVTPETHLNMWICNIGGGILGYAQFPGGDPTTDGVVFSPQYCGSSDYDDGSFFLDAPFDKGRTATHEVGHYLNLRHIWGDGRCRQDDFVADTPTSDSPNYGCPSYPSVACKSNDMTMNYMDYTNDACMYMYTEGQKQRMRSIFAAGGPRNSML